MTAEAKDLVDAFDKYDIDFGFMDYTRSQLNRESHLLKREARDHDLSAFSSLNLDDSAPETETKQNSAADIKAKDDDDDDDATAATDSSDADDTKKSKSSKVNTSGFYNVGNSEDDSEKTPARSKSATREIILDIAAGDDRAREEVLNVNHLGYVKAWAAELLSLHANAYIDSFGLSVTLKVECMGCHIKGKLNLAGHLEVSLTNAGACTKPV